MRKKIIIFGILSIIYIVGFPFIKEYMLDAPYLFTVVVGEKDEKSSGTEIWLDNISKDGESLDLNTLPLGDNWENRGRIYNPGSEKSRWKICIRSRKETVITFLTHPYSGVVKITDPKGNIEIINLYSPEEGKYEYVYTVKEAH